VEKRMSLGAPVCVRCLSAGRLFAMAALVAIGGCVAPPTEDRAATESPSTSPTVTSAVVGPPVPALTVAPAAAADASRTSEVTADEGWLDEMIAHHEGSIRPAVMMVGSTRPGELGTLAQRIQERDQREVQRMQEWRVQWFGTAGPPEQSQNPFVVLTGLAMRGSGLPDGFGPSASGGQGSTGRADMDRTFLQLMIPYEQLAVDMANDALQRTQRDELKGLARDMVGQRSAEIQTMVQYLRDWYGESLSPTDVSQQAERLRAAVTETARDPAAIAR
jgi:uncharacterized protein (DUF305 family)